MGKQRLNDLGETVKNKHGLAKFAIDERERETIDRMNPRTLSHISSTLLAIAVWFAAPSPAQATCIWSSSYTTNNAVVIASGCDEWFITYGYSEAYNEDPCIGGGANAQIYYRLCSTLTSWWVEQCDQFYPDGSDPDESCPDNCYVIDSGVTNDSFDELVTYCMF